MAPEWRSTLSRPARGETVPVEIVPDKPGEHGFACAMGTFRGKLIVE